MIDPKMMKPKVGNPIVKKQNFRELALTRIEMREVLMAPLVPVGNIVEERGTKVFSMCIRISFNSESTKDEIRWWLKNQSRCKTCVMQEAANFWSPWRCSEILMGRRRDYGDSVMVYEWNQNECCLLKHGSIFRFYRQPIFGTINNCISSLKCVRCLIHEYLFSRMGSLFLLMTSKSGTWII